MKKFSNTTATLAILILATLSFSSCRKELSESMHNLTDGYWQNIDDTGDNKTPLLFFGDNMRLKPYIYESAKNGFDAYYDESNRQTYMFDTEHNTLFLSPADKWYSVYVLTYNSLVINDEQNTIKYRKVSNKSVNTMSKSQFENKHPNND